jgi:cell division protein FtsX
MSTLGFSARLGWNTLKSRPTLTVLAILLITTGVLVTSVVMAARYVLNTARSELLAGPGLEIELSNSDSQIGADIMSRVEAWLGVSGATYLSPEQVMHEIEANVGDSLANLLGANAFPAMVRAHFAEPHAQTVDSLASIARQWPNVTSVVYPRNAWNDLTRLIDKVRRWLMIGALPLYIFTLILTALCLRAQVRNRKTTWEFLSLLGMSRATSLMALSTQQLVVGVLAGMLSCGLLWGTVHVSQWLLLHEFRLPALYFISTLLAGIVTAQLAGLATRSPRP